MSNHPTQDEAVDQLRARLAELDPDHSISWAEVERRAVQHTPLLSESESFEAAEGPKLERMIAALREEADGE